MKGIKFCCNDLENIDNGLILYTWQKELPIYFMNCQIYYCPFCGKKLIVEEIKK